MLLPRTAISRQAPPISVGVVADRETTRGALVSIIEDDPELAIAGSAASPELAEPLLRDPDLRVLLVNLPLGAPAHGPQGIAFIRHVKRQRPALGVLSLKRDVDEPYLRAALDAGADACCMATTSQTRLLQAIKAVAAGATWLDPEISNILLRSNRPEAARSAIHLSPREREILRLLTDGYTNEEIASRLNCGAATVKTHLLHLFRKLGVRDRVSAAVVALRGGLL